MQFNDRVVQTLADKPPEGWPERLSVDEYEGLESERKTYYSALYAKCRVKKFREYGEYGEFLGWEPRQIGVGKPVGYKYHGAITAKVVQDVLRSNVLMSRVVHKRNPFN